jgi:hypothetical protein
VGLDDTFLGEIDGLFHGKSEDKMDDKLGIPP